MYTLEMQDNMKDGDISIHESKALNLSELQKEIDSWGVAPRIIKVFKTGRHIVDIFDGEMQLRDNTIIN